LSTRKSRSRSRGSRIVHYDVCERRLLHAAPAAWPDVLKEMKFA
jgi:hypothetical protein